MRTGLVGLLPTAVWRRTSLLAVFVALLSSAANAQPDPSDTFEDQTSVLEIQIPVNVTDRNGRPVHGLTVEDFEVLDEGKKQTITSFRLVDLETLEPGPKRAETPYGDVIPAAARRHILFLFDLTFSTPPALLRARKAAQEFVVSSMHESDLAAVAIHSVELGPQLVVTFTPDRAQLARAIDTLGSPQLLEQAAVDPLRFVIDRTDGDAGLVTGDLGENNALAELENMSSYLSVIGNQINKMERSFQLTRVSSWSSSMSELARVLGSIEGRKHLIYFTEGFDGRLLLGRQPDTTDPEAEADYVNIQRGQYHLVDQDQTFGNTLLQKQVSGMLEEFRRADCVLQVVDISGLRADLPSEDRRRRVNDDALYYLANETGGELYENANDFAKQIGKALTSTNLTYLLSFRPSDVGEPGSHHRVRVKLNEGRKLRISHRSGYYAPRPFGELHPLEKNLIAGNFIANAAPVNDLDMNVLVAPFRATRDTAYVPVIIEIGGESLLVGQEGDSLPVELYAYVTDDKGQMKDFFTQLVGLNLKSRRVAFASTGMKYYGHLDLGPGHYLVRVLARNALTGRAGVKAVPLVIPEFQATATSLLPPFFLEAPGHWFLVKERSEGDQLTYPFTVNGEPYVPSAAPVLDPEDTAELCLVAYNFGEGRLVVDSRVLDAEGLPVEGGEFAIMERTITGVRGLDKLVASFRATGLNEGDYTLEVSVMDPSSQATELSSIPIRVHSAARSAEGP